MSKIWDVGDTFADKNHPNMIGWVTKAHISISPSGQDAIYTVIFDQHVSHYNRITFTFDQIYADKNWTQVPDPSKTKIVQSATLKVNGVDIGKISDVSIKMNPMCDHKWEQYHGLRESYKYCTECDEKEKK